MKGLETHYRKHKPSSRQQVNTKVRRSARSRVPKCDKDVNRFKQLVEDIKWESSWFCDSLIWWPSSLTVEGRMWWTIAFLLLCFANVSRGSGRGNAKVWVLLTRSFEVFRFPVVFITHSLVLPFIDRHYWYVCFVILFLHFVQRPADHPIARSLPESKLNDLAERTDYQTFYDDIFLKGVYRVRVPGTTGHHKVKMVRKITDNVSVLPLRVQVNKLATLLIVFWESSLLKQSGTVSL